MKLTERYHPERYRMSRPFARQATTLYQSLTGTATLSSYETLKQIATLIGNFYNSELSHLEFSERPNNTKNLANEQSLAMHYSSWASHGRQIFHFNEEITEQFRLTDADEITIGSLKFPYNIFYMSFGSQSDLELDNSGRFVDGAYVSVIPDFAIQVLLTTRPLESKIPQRFDWIKSSDKYYYLPLSIKEPTANIAIVAEKAISDDIQEREAKLKTAKPTMDVGGIEIPSRRPQSIKEEIHDLSAGYPIFKNALSLIINGLCYLSAYPDDIEHHWPSDTPKPLLEKIEKAAKPKDVQKATSQLTSMGFTKIHYCGKAFQHHNQTDSEGSEVRAHWRRGHWRNQSYGPQSANRKMIWIMPVMVRKDKTHGNIEMGHVYLV